MAQTTKRPKRTRVVSGKVKNPPVKTPAPTPLSKKEIADFRDSWAATEHAKDGSILAQCCVLRAIKDRHPTLSVRAIAGDPGNGKSKAIVGVLSFKRKAKRKIEGQVRWFERDYTPSHSTVARYIQANKYIDENNLDTESTDTWSLTHRVAFQHIIAHGRSQLDKFMAGEVDAKGRKLDENGGLQTEKTKAERVIERLRSALKATMDKDNGVDVRDAAQHIAAHPALVQAVSDAVQAKAKAAK